VKENMYPFIIQSLIIQSKLASLEGKLDHAETFLEQAIALAESKNLATLLMEVQEVKHSMKEEIIEMKALLTTNATFSQRLEKSSIMDYLRKAQGMIHDETN
jgi:hypothetical protein